MAELTSRERLQPSLLDRLTDDEPDQRQESRDQRVLNTRQLRESVRRDLSWLFNSTNLGKAHDLQAMPLVEKSVVNYGLPELAGHMVSSTDVTLIERQIKQAIVNFEPRILADTVEVRMFADRENMSNNALMFEIQGVLWAQPIPQQLYLKTEVDLEVGDVQILDYSAQ